MNGLAPPEPRVVGLDLSLTSTGASDGTEHRVFKTSSTEVLEVRFDRLIRQCVSFCISAHLVVIEGSAFGAKGNAKEQLAGLRYAVRTRLHRFGLRFVIVSPTALKAWTTGDGKADKDKMVDAVLYSGWADFSSVPKTHGRYDLADACALAMYGRAHYDALIRTANEERPS
jgi:Holliday junction resolvasome RuvABC endonuclease subunit